MRFLAQRELRLRNYTRQTILLGFKPVTMILFFYRYESFVGTVAKKFATKRKRSSVAASFESDSPSIHQPSKKTKREFMKPRD